MHDGALPSPRRRRKGVVFRFGRELRRRDRRLGVTRFRRESFGIEVCSDSCHTEEQRNRGTESFIVSSVSLFLCVNQSCSRRLKPERSSAIWYESPLPAPHREPPQAPSRGGSQSYGTRSNLASTSRRAAGKRHSASRRQLPVPAGPGGSEPQCKIGPPGSEAVPRSSPATPRLS